MADRLSGSGWFPTPPPKPLKAPSAATLVFGTILPAVAVVGAVADGDDSGAGRLTDQAGPAPGSSAAAARRLPARAASSSGVSQSSIVVRAARSAPARNSSSTSAGSSLAAAACRGVQSLRP